MSNSLGVQLLQRGFIITSQGGGPVDASEVVEGISDASELQDKLNQVFANTGGLYYGKKVFVKELEKYFFYSHDTQQGEGIWKEIE